MWGQFSCVQCNVTNNYLNIQILIHVNWFRCVVVCLHVITCLSRQILHLAQKPTSIQSHGRCLGEVDLVSIDHFVASLEHAWKIIKWWIIENTSGRNWGYIKLQATDCWTFGRCPKQTTTMSKQYPDDEV